MEQELTQKLVTGMPQNKGFTLIEILIVIVIIGITISFAVIAFGNFGENKRILFAADQLTNTLKLAQQQSILETSTLGLAIDNQSWQLMKLEHPSKWHSPPNKNLFKIYYFPENTRVMLKTDTRYPAGVPAIIINSSGEITAFTLTLGTLNEPNIVSIKSTPKGTLHLIKNEDK